jgi:hypothetical protein
LNTYFVDHTVGLYPIAASGSPFTCDVFQSKGDPITDLFEDMRRSRKRATTYDNILRLSDDPDVNDPTSFEGAGSRALPSVSAKHCGSPRISWTRRISTPSNPSFDK